MRITRTRYAVTALAATAALLAGCANEAGSSTGSSATASASAPTPTPAGNGVAELEPAAIISKATAALVAVKSFRVKGKFAEDGQSIGLDFKVRGKDVVGTMTIGKAKIELLRVGKQQFIRPDKAFWKQNIGSAKKAETISTVLNGRWVKVTAKDKGFADMFSVTDISKLLEPDGGVVKGGVQTVDGKKAIALKESGSDAGTLFVATEGAPYPLRMVGPTPADGGLVFTDFGATFTDLKAPTATEFVDFAKLSS